MAVEAAVQAVMSHTEFDKRFKHPMKFDGTDFKEVRLSSEEQRTQLLEMASKQLHVFLERYGDLLGTTDLKALSSTPGAETPEVQFWLARLGQEPISNTSRQKRARGQRLIWSQNEEEKPDGFFCEEEMQKRQPMLGKSMIGRHLQEGNLEPPRLVPENQVARGFKRGRSGSPELEHSPTPSQLSQRLAALEERMAHMDGAMDGFAYELDERICRKWEVYSRSEVDDRLGFQYHLIQKEMTHLKKKLNDQIFEFDRRFQDLSKSVTEACERASQSYIRKDMDRCLSQFHTKEEVDELIQRTNTKVEKIEQRMNEDFYTKTECDIAVSLGSAESRAHVKTELGEMLGTVCTKEQVEAEMQALIASVYTKDQVEAEMQALIASVYTKDQVDNRLNSFYRKHEADAEIEEYMACVYTKDQVDDHLKSFYGRHEVDDQVAHVYVKIRDELGPQIRQRVAQRQFDVILDSIYTKAEIDQKIAQICTPAEVDQIMIPLMDQLSRNSSEGNRCLRHLSRDH